MKKLFNFIDKISCRWFQTPKIETADAFICFILLIITFFQHTYNIQHPNRTVFDEVYFGNFTNYYLKHTFFFDIHPPLGKLLMASIGYLAEYDGELQFQDCPESGYHEPDYVQLRLTPALLSSLCIPFIYMSMRFLSFSKIASFSSAFLLMCDTSFVAEARHILSDGVLIFFSSLHIMILCYTITVPLHDRNFKFWHIINGISLGAACSCKNTAWGLMGFDAIGYILMLLPSLKIGILDYLFDVAFYGITLFLLQFSVYIMSFIIHFTVLCLDGPGKGYLPIDMQNQLMQGGMNSLGVVLLTGRSLLSRIIWLAYDMHKGNMGITQFHDSMSYPYHWPILGSVSVYFYGRDGTEIRCLGNVFTYYPALLGVFLCFFRIGKKNGARCLFIVFGYCACYFPFYLIPRVMYLYHYFIPLCIACMAFGAAIDSWLTPKQRGFVCVVFCAFALFGYWLWSPYVYAGPMRDRQRTIWNQNWIDGDQAHRKRREEYYKTKTN